jgi:isopentenyl phosphate kinase
MTTACRHLVVHNSGSLSHMYTVTELSTKLAIINQIVVMSKIGLTIRSLSQCIMKHTTFGEMTITLVPISCECHADILTKRRD